MYPLLESNKYMKTRIVITNILFIIALFFKIGGGIFSNIGYVLFALYLVIMFFLFGKEILASFFNSSTVSIYIFLFFVFLTSGLNVNTCLALFFTFMPCMLIDAKRKILLRSENTRAVEKMCFFTILGILMYYSYQSLVVLESNPMALRHLVSEAKDDNIIVGGGFALPYSMAILCPFLLHGSRQMASVLERYFVYVVIAVGSYLVFRALFTTALLLMIIGYVIVILGRVSSKKRIRVFVFGGLLLILFIQVLPLMTQYFLDQDFNVVGRRLQEISNMMNGNTGNDDGDLQSRINLSLRSIETFFNNPIWGIGPSVKYDYFEMEKSGVGSHAQWFDIFAIYGLFAILIVTYLRKVSKSISQNNITLKLFVILGFLNPIFIFTIVFVVYYIVPMFNFLWPQKNK